MIINDFGVKLEKSDVLLYYNNLLTEYTIKAFQEGTTKEDSVEIKKIICEMREMFFTSKDEIYDIFSRFNHLYYNYEAYMPGIPLGLFLYDKVSLTQLVSANNKDKKTRMYSDDGTMFSCQFHNENTPSMGVSNGKKLFYCFGCGETGNAIDYIMNYENLTYQEAVCLLSKIYLIDLDFNVIDENDERVLKYRNNLISDKNIKRINKGIERLDRRTEGKNEEMLPMYLVRSYKTYQDELKTIKRIKNNEHLKYVAPPKNKVLVYK